VRPARDGCDDGSWRTRRCVLLACAVAALVDVNCVRAQESAAAYPSRNFRFIVGFTAGGGPDATSRRLAQGIAEKTGRNVVVDNRPGATGLIGMSELARANPDGYTIGIINMASPVIQVMMAKPPVDIGRDLAPVVQLFRQYTVLVVRPELPVRTPRELIEMIRAAPGAHSFASGGNGTPAHLAGELFVRSMGLKANHVPYKGMTIGIADIIRGDVLFACSVIANVSNLIQGGRLKALAVLGPKRIAAFPELPSFVELGLPDVDVSSWAGVVAPAGTPVALRAKLGRILVEVADDPSHAKGFAALGLERSQADHEVLGALIRSDLVRWARFVKETGIRMD
jgi:tripartite-type tricarboxylate transporter receptor subunit TctC